MKAYLDTCIVSGLAKSDLSSTELEAFNKILDLHDAGSVELFTSAEVADELSAIPEKHRESHLEVFERFLDLPRIEKIGGVTRLGPMGLPTSNPLRKMRNRLKEAGLDETDAMHVFIATTNRVEYFVTTDKKTILRYADQIKEASGIKAVLPSDFQKLLESSTAR